MSNSHVFNYKFKSSEFTLFSINLELYQNWSFFFPSQKLKMSEIPSSSKPMKELSSDYPQELQSILPIPETLSEKTPIENPTSIKVLAELALEYLNQGLDSTIEQELSQPEISPPQKNQSPLMSHKFPFILKNR